MLELHGVNKSFGEPLITDLELTLSPGDRLGILGPNGCGKSTLLDILRGVQLPDSGERIQGSRVQISTLDQARTGLNTQDTVLESVTDPGLLERFLFPRTMHAQRVQSLSGGERARLLMARLLQRGANVLLLDEPTNDLDLQTLRVLEEALLAYDGAAVIVTHDRALLDRVCTSVLAREEDGRWQIYADRLQHLAATKAIKAAPTTEPRPTLPTAERPKSSSNKLNNREREELGALPKRIEALEAEQAEVGERLGDPSIYRDRPDEVIELTERLRAIPGELETLFERWESLEERA